MKIGQRIKEARINKKLTQQQLGDLVGVQKSAIAKYESGRVVNIKRSTLQKIASALDIRPSELVFEATPKESAVFHVKVISDLELMDALKDYYKLSEENKRIVREIIHNLVAAEK